VEASRRLAKRGKADSLGGRVAVAGLLAVVATAGVLTALSLTVRDLSVKHDEAHRAKEAITAAARLERSVLDLQSGSRGFVISGQRRFLEPFIAARAQVPVQRAEIERLLADRPGARAEVRALGLAIADYVDAYASPLIALARRSPDAAQTRVASGRGHRLVGGLRRRFAALTAGLEALGDARIARADEQADRALVLAVVLVLVPGALVLGLIAYLRRAVVRPVGRVAAAAVRLANGDLSARVAEAGSREARDLGQAFNAMAADLSAADRAKEEVLALVSHELRAPLTPIGAYAELLLDDERALREPDPVRVRGLESIEHNARRLGRLVDDLLLAAESRTGRLSVRREPVDLTSIVRNCVAAAEPAARERGVALDSRTRGGLVAVGDEERLEQALDNLIDNALKFTPAGGRVRVKLAAVGDHARLEVADTGAGIPAGEQTRLFERFYRADPSKRPAVHGLGIGLSVVRAVAEAHGGRATVRSTEGAGAEFAVEVPLGGRR
jgi:signal transduction histidine kinase